jgi:quercetin dioxygenase-like cupin family protein
MLKPIRRVVTGHDARGRSVIVSDGPSPHVLALPGLPDFGLTNLWVTDATPASNEGQADAAARPVVLEPPPGGSILRVVEFPPDKAPGGFDRKAAFAAMGADHAMDPDASRHPGMHKTSTVDYAIVLAGEIWALMDVGETLLKAGDCLVQRGTNHAWSNRSDQPCLVAFILIAARPLARS